MKKLRFKIYSLGNYFLLLWNRMYFWSRKILIIKQWQHDVVIQPLSRVWLFATLWTAACQAPLSSTICWSLLKFMFIELAMPSNHLILCHSLLLVPSIFPSVSTSRPFASGGQSIGASTTVLPISIQGWFPLGLTGLIFLQSKGLSRVFSSTTIRKHPFFSTQPSLWSSSHIHTPLLEKP